MRMKVVFDRRPTGGTYFITKDYKNKYYFSRRNIFFQDLAFSTFDYIMTFKLSFFMEEAEYTLGGT
jgi:hypothetical protein